MNIALCVVDMQHDFLRETVPHKQQIVDAVEDLLRLFRETSKRIIHVRTSVAKEQGPRMPHWEQQSKWSCVVGSSGHKFAVSTKPQEMVIDKTFFSAFSAPLLQQTLTNNNIDSIVIAGVHTHSCIRATAMDAYQCGYKVYIAQEAVASYDPIHAAISQYYLDSRSMNFVSTSQIKQFLQPTSKVVIEESTAVAYIDKEVMHTDKHECYLHYSPTECNTLLYAVPIATTEVSLAAQHCKSAQRSWQKRVDRAVVLRNFIDLFAQEIDHLTQMMVEDIGKPFVSAQVEAQRSIDLMTATLTANIQEKPCSDYTKIRYCPLGTIAIITPWNNPVGIPLGKIIPALYYGNTVVWKPAPQGTRIACHIMDILRKSTVPDSVVNMVAGDHTTSCQLMLDNNIDAVTISGSIATGNIARSLWAIRGIPLQAELGGNNPTIVWRDSCREKVAQKIVGAAFDFAGQRCTATSRVIVHEDDYQQFYDLLKTQTQKLNFGSPHDKNTQVGPMISKKAQNNIMRILERNISQVEEVWQFPYNAEKMKAGAYLPPTIITCSDTQCEIVQHENFAPVLVIQKAQSWRHALTLCNNVSQGLAAALFSSCETLQQEFLDTVEAGMLKINCTTTKIECHTPFAGWKSSAVGPPEHGEGNREFYTKRQSIYF